jgi:hypothetical protein
MSIKKMLAAILWVQLLQMVKPAPAQPSNW